MAFTVNMEYLEQPFRIKWDNGEVETDQMFEVVLENASEFLSESDTVIGPVGMQLDPTDWTDGLTFLWLCITMADEGTFKTSGEVPEPPVAPEGGVN